MRSLLVGLGVGLVTLAVACGGNVVADGKPGGSGALSAFSGGSGGAPAGGNAGGTSASNLTTGVACTQPGDCAAGRNLLLFGPLGLRDAR